MHDILVISIRVERVVFIFQLKALDFRVIRFVLINRSIPQSI